MNWTEEQIAQLKQLWGSGLTAQQIADILGVISRNAVIGKANRLKLPTLDKQTSLGAKPKEEAPKIKAPKPALSSRAATKAKQTVMDGFEEKVKQLEEAAQSLAQAESEPEIIEEELPEPEMLRLSLLELTGATCKWPIDSGDEGQFYFCGQLAESSGSYCAYHAKIAFHPNQIKRRKANQAS